MQKFGETHAQKFGFFFGIQLIDGSCISIEV